MPLDLYAGRVHHDGVAFFDADDVVDLDLAAALDRTQPDVFPGVERRQQCNALDRRGVLQRRGIEQRARAAQQVQPGLARGNPHLEFIGGLAPGFRSQQQIARPGDRATRGVGRHRSRAEGCDFDERLCGGRHRAAAACRKQQDAEQTAYESGSR